MSSSSRGAGFVATLRSLSRQRIVVVVAHPLWGQGSLHREGKDPGTR